MRASPRRRAAFLLLYGALLAWQVDRWFFTPHGLVSTWGARHDDRSVAVTSPRGVSQSFTMGADGLSGVWLIPRGADGTPRGDLLVDLIDVGSGVPIRLERVAMPASEVVRTASLRVPFRPRHETRGRAFRLDVRHVNATGGPGIDLAVSRADVLPEGQLFADGAEQWGDLVFETASDRATLPYWIHEVLRPWPAWVRSWPVIGLVLLVFNLALAWACALATGVLGTPAAAGVDDGAASLVLRPATGSVGRLAIGCACVVAAGGVVIAARPTGRYRALDLLAALPEARLAHERGTLHASISPGPVVFDGRLHRAVVSMPPSSLTWVVELPREAVLRVGAAMRPDVWEREGDGIQMRVLVDHAGGRAVGAELTLFPFGVPEHRRLFPVEVPLHQWAGQRVRITLQSTPERFGNAVNDVPVWTEPRIEWPRNPAAGQARVIAP